MALVALVKNSKQMVKINPEWLKEDDLEACVNYGYTYENFKEKIVFYSPNFDDIADFQVEKREVFVKSIIALYEVYIIKWLSKYYLGFNMITVEAENRICIN